MRSDIDDKDDGRVAATGGSWVEFVPRAWAGHRGCEANKVVHVVRSERARRAENTTGGGELGR